MATTSDALRVTDRTRLRRKRDRGSFDRTAAYAVLDEGLVAHVGIVREGAPVVLPMAYARIDDRLYLHGAVGNGLLRGASGAQVCVTVTLLDGLVLARSAFHHSMEYRSVVLYGEAERVDDEAEQAAAVAALVDHVVPGRATVVRPVTSEEIRTTLFLRLAIDEASLKARSAGVADDPVDADHPVWAGVVPLRLTAGEPLQDPPQLGSGAILRAPTAEELDRGRATLILDRQQHGRR